MKKKVFCAMLLVLWVLVVCTLLSIRVEDLMMPRVTVSTPNMDGSLPSDCVFSDEMGMHLFYTVEGTGWESGIRVRENPNGVSLDEDGTTVQGGFGSSFIRYASKFPKLGEKVMIEQTNARGADTWLVVAQEEPPLVEKLPFNVEQLAKAGNDLLFGVTQVSQTYMEKEAQSTLFGLQAVAFNSIPPDVRVYSLTDINTFIRQLPLLSGLLVLLIVPVILWAFSCLLARKARANRPFLWVNGALAAAMVVGMAFLLHAIQIPASMMPLDHVTDFSHYTQELEEAFAGLRALTAHPLAAEALTYAGTRQNLAVGVLLIGFLLTAIGLTVEAILVKKRAVRAETLARRAAKLRDARQEEFQRSTQPVKGQSVLMERDQTRPESPASTAAQPAPRKVKADDRKYVPRHTKEK